MLTLLPVPVCPEEMVLLSPVWLTRALAERPVWLRVRLLLGPPLWPKKARLPSIA
jgi:hypothetical protein